MAVRPIRIDPESVHIRADRRLAFQLVSSFARGEDVAGAAPRVIEQDGGRMLVEFATPVKWGFGLTTVFRTREWVTPREPEQIDFRLVPGKGPITGGLKLLEDSFVFEDAEGCTDLHYESTFGIRWSVWGWIVGKLFVERFLKRHMRDHLATLKRTIEERARRSRVFEMKCDH